MGIVKRILLLIEFLIGFAPAVILLIVGLMFTPVFLLNSLEGRFDSLPLVVAGFFGVIGFWGAISLLTLTLQPESPNANPRKLRAAIIMGVISLIACLVFINASYTALIVIGLAPLIVTLHLLILQRGYFRQNGN